MATKKRKRGESDTSGKPDKPDKSVKPKTKYRLTVAADKQAVLLRLPKSAIKIIDAMARENKSKRTSVLYEVIGSHPRLIDCMQPLLSDLATNETETD